jgi:hypothetical protein
MQARDTAAAFLAVLLASGCTTSDVPAPLPSSVEPGTGYGGTPTPVVIHGTGFVLRAAQPSSGGSPTVDTRFRAWLGEAELPDVVWVDQQTLRATVPAGLPAGSHALVVEGPFGSRGRLEDAFVVAPLPGAALRATASALPATASVGQDLRLTLVVANEGTTDAVDVTPGTPTLASADGAAATPVDGPLPPSVASLRPGQSATFVWTWRATAPGALSFDVRAAGVDVFSRQTVTVVPPAPARATVQRLPVLSAALGAPSTAALGSDFAVTMTVTNSGEAAAVAVTPAPLALEPGSSPVVPRYGPTPASADVPGAGGTATFVWTYNAGATAGQVRFRGEAAGRDANSGAAVTTGSVTSAAVTVGHAALVADLAAAPGIVGIGQGITLTLRLVNPGSVAVTGITPSVPTVGGTGAATASAAGPAPASIPSLGPNEAATFAWTYTATAAGQIDFAASASGTDSASGASVSATANLVRAVTVQGAAALAVSGFTALPSPAVANQAVAVSLTLVNGGDSPASVSAVTPTAAPSGTARCTAPAPAPPATIVAGGSLRLSWTCTATAAGSYTLGATVRATDAGSGADLSPAVTGIPVTVLEPASLAVSAFAASPNPASANQAVAVSLALANTGGAPASVTAMTPQAGPGKIACAAAAPSPPQTIPAGGGMAFTWTCTATSARTYTLGATVTAADAISGANVSPAVTGIPLTVVKAPAFTSAALVPGEPVLVAVDPLGDGTSAASLAVEGGELLVGPGTDGQTLARLEAGGSAQAAPALPVELAPAALEAPEWVARLEVTGTPGTASGPTPFLAAFGDCGGPPCLFAVRAVQGSATQPPVVPQLWRCSPSRAGERCSPGEWSLAVPNGSGDPMLTQLEGETNGAPSLLAATPRWLYLGFDNPSTGVQLYRAARAPSGASDFAGRDGCPAGLACQGLGGNGFGDALTRFLSARVVEAGGATSLWIVAGDGTRPLRVYRVPE